MPLAVATGRNRKAMLKVIPGFFPVQDKKLFKWGT
jgi:hypothetical protein